jgi:hypothetical protein
LESAHKHTHKKEEGRVGVLQVSETINKPSKQSVPTREKRTRERNKEKVGLCLITQQTFF